MRLFVLLAMILMGMLAHAGQSSSQYLCKVTYCFESHGQCPQDLKELSLELDGDKIKLIIGNETQVHGKKLVGNTTVRLDFSDGDQAEVVRFSQLGYTRLLEGKTTRGEYIIGYWYDKFYTDFTAHLMCTKK